jgi:hypothetical protein
MTQKRAVLIGAALEFIALAAVVAMTLVRK